MFARHSSDLSGQAYEDQPKEGEEDSLDQDCRLHRLSIAPNWASRSNLSVQRNAAAQARAANQRAGVSH